MKKNSTTKRTLPWKDNIAYAMGSMGVNFMFALISFYLMYFYTDVMGISAAAAGMLLLVARVWDAVNDPVMGSIVDKTHTRWGKFRPFIIIGIVPGGLLFMLTFYTPDLSIAGKTIWAYATYLPMLMAVTFIYIPYHAQSTVMTTNSLERAEVAAMQQVTGIIATLIVAAGTLPLVKSFATPQKGFFYAAGIFGLASVVCYFITFVRTKQYDLPKDQVKQGNTKAKFFTFKERIKVVTHNRPLLSAVISYLFFQIGLTIMTGMAVYFFKYYVEMEEFYPVIMGSFMVTMVAGILCIPVLTRIMGKKNLYQLSNILATLSLIVVFYLCNTPDSALVAQSFNFGPLFFIFLSHAFWNGPVIALIWGIVPDTVEFAEWKIGIRAEGLVFATLGFMQKTALGLAGAVAGAVLSIIDYVPNQPQSSDTLFGILVIFCLVPIACRVLTSIAMCFYNLTEEDFATIVNKLETAKLAES